MTQYIEVEDARRYMGVNAPDDDPLLEELIESASQEIDDHCHRTFVARTETRQYSIYYQGFAGGGEGLQQGGPYVLHLDDDLLSVTTFTNGDGTVIPSTGYYLEPRNYSPTSILRLKFNPVSVFVWNTDASVTVAGSWGYSTAPNATIKQATRRMVAFLYNQRGAAVYDVTAEPGAGVITVPQGIPADVALMLKPYRRTYLW